MIDKITSWSFSRWAKYNSCPLAAKFAYVNKIKEPSSEALERGTALHELCENYLKGKIEDIPGELQLITKQLQDFKERSALAEAEFTFTNDWEPTGWFDKNAWLRVKADVTIQPILDADEPIVEIHDFKSGKVREGASEYMLQLELYALAGLLTYPLATKAKTSLVFIDHGKVIEHEKVFTRDDIAPLKKAWELRTRAMLADAQFKPTPGNACRWCFFRKSNEANGGGQCQY